VTEQATLASSVVFSGVGLHTGAECRVEIAPAPPDTGYVFVSGGVRIPAIAEYAIESDMATVLGRDGVTVSTVEHVLSALMGCGIANAELRVEGPEIPVVDGSARAFCDAIARAGIVPQKRPRAAVRLSEPFGIADGDRAIIAMPARNLRVRFVADFPPPVGTQYRDIGIDPQSYDREIAAARTFGYLHDVEALRARGLARGGSLENAVVFDSDGPLRPLLWPDEVVRHKILDLLGDLALLGAWLEADVIAVKSGHRLHARFARALRERRPAVTAVSGAS